MKDPAWRPMRVLRLQRTIRASAVGARMPLVAFNVNLDSEDVELARRIAGRIRESGAAAHLAVHRVFLESRSMPRCP
jgi:glutamate formiminotransferase